MSPAGFRLGRVVATSGALAALSPEDILVAVSRHLQGDWGEVNAEDQGANDRALEEGNRLLSVYRAAAGTPFWIITEANRTVTTVLLPDEY